MRTKTCPRCKKEKDEEEFFYKEIVRKQCNPCREYIKAANRKWYAEGKGKTYEKQREYRLELFNRQLPEGLKRCRGCLQIKSIDDFKVRKGEAARCSVCRGKYGAYMRACRARWSDEKRKQVSAKLKVIRDARKRLVINHYGGKCKCCGETALEFLAMDHIIKIGTKARKENGESGDRFYRSIIARNFPDKYRVLCFNCNWSIGIYGYCPHQRHHEHPIEQAIRTMPMAGTVQ